ncbi:MAG: hypothetical protein QOI10_3612 [Solirubrobacterales bacterium]|jgi:hypothetical protein|nr:hypothetical protein [Solirubrobacterales bacterium]
MHMIHAEKIVTAVQRGTANTRWRDFGDILTLSRRHSVDGSDLQRAIREVARGRATVLAPLAEILDGVLRFADPPLLGQVSNLTWTPGKGNWR